MPQFQNFTAEDKIIESTIVTKGFFQGDLGTLPCTSLATSSIVASQQAYYANLAYSSVDHFSVTFGHYAGTGSTSTINGYGETKAIYQQMADYLLLPEEVQETGFKFDGTNKAEHVYFLVANRARMKDRMNRKNWTLELSGSSLTKGTGVSLSLTDDSADVAAAASVVGPRYNIVKGASGVVTTPASTTCYGWFYPDMGIWALDGAALSGSIPGTKLRATNHSSQSYGPAGAENGFHLDSGSAAKNHMQLVQAMTTGSGNHLMRNEESLLTTAYFVRAKSNHWNCSNNPTYTTSSGRDNTYRIKEMTGNPRTFISTIGLYNAQNKCVAVGRLSTAVEKAYDSEAYIKIKVNY